ncbi:MAG: hypothetical protein IJ171_06205 [Ruminococcus sp.]|nr:hypothetical protein [Ruminococcus sp.]
MKSVHIGYLSVGLETRQSAALLNEYTMSIAVLQEIERSGIAAGLNRSKQVKKTQMRILAETKKVLYGGAGSVIQYGQAPFGGRERRSDKNGAGNGELTENR